MESLSLADRVILAGVFKSESIPAAERLIPENVITGLCAGGVHAELLLDADAIVAALAPSLDSGDVVAILSNGGFGGIYEKLPRALERR